MSLDELQHDAEVGQGTGSPQGLATPSTVPSDLAPLASRTHQHWLGRPGPWGATAR